MDLPEYGQAILKALASGYLVDAKQGLIYGLKGAPLTIALHGTQRYPTVCLAVKGMPRKFYAVPAHKVVAAALWGAEAFRKGIQVRHGAEGVLVLKETNLALGTAAENQADKPKHIRVKAAKVARAAQPAHGNNNKVTKAEAELIRTEYTELKRLYPRKIPNGTVSRMQAKYGLSGTTIHNIAKGKTWKS